MIIIGYQGIGKSTLANKDKNFIDLESSNFWVDGNRADDWYKPYCNIAEHLSQQGYTVFTSSHEVVRNRLAKSEEKVYCCLPIIEIRAKWVEKLAQRWETTGLDKDYKAYMNARERYTENVLEIAHSLFDVIWIYDTDYDLKEAIEQATVND